MSSSNHDGLHVQDMQTAVGSAWHLNASIYGYMAITAYHILQLCALDTPRDDQEKVGCVACSIKTAIA